MLVLAEDACGNATDPLTPIQAGYITINHDSRQRRNRGCIPASPPRHSRAGGQGGGLHLGWDGQP